MSLFYDIPKASICAICPECKQSVGTYKTTE